MAVSPAARLDPGATLLRARRAAGLTQREVAGRTGVDQAAIARIERGEARPRIDTLVALLGACGWMLVPAPRPPASEDIDRPELRRLIRSTDREREAYFLASNANMLRLFAEARTAR